MKVFDIIMLIILWFLTVIFISAVFHAIGNDFLAYIACFVVGYYYGKELYKVLKDK